VKPHKAEGRESCLGTNGGTLTFTVTIDIKWEAAGLHHGRRQLEPM